MTASAGFIWVQGGSAAGGNSNRLTTTGGMPGTMQYNSSRRGTQIYANGIAFADPYNGNSNNDSGWIRHIEETSNSGYLEIAVGDDGANENIYLRRYNTSNAVAQSINVFTDLITTSNISSQSVNYATSAGNADTLDGVHNGRVTASKWWTTSHVDDWYERSDWDGTYFWLKAMNGSGSTLPSAVAYSTSSGNADTVDNLHGSDFIRNLGGDGGSISGFYNTATSNRAYYWGFDGGGTNTYAVHWTNLQAGYANNADTVDGYHAGSLWRSDGGTWNPSANISLPASGNGQEWSFDITRNGYTGCYWHVWDSSRSTMLQVTPDDGKVRAPYGFVGDLSGTASYASRAAYLDGHGVNPNNSHPGYGARVFYSWNSGQAGNADAGYSNGITIGSHPSDQAYGFQIVQNMWDDRTYTRRYNGGWQDWKTLAWYSDFDVDWPSGVCRGFIKGNEISTVAHLLINNATWASNWYWSGQGGQPTWLWGSNDGTNMYIWNPSNFSVNYANSAGSVAWSNVTSRPTNLNQFTNGPGYITSSGSCSYASSSNSSVYNTVTEVSNCNSANGENILKYYRMQANASNLFTANSNANGLLWVGTHAGSYGHQIGFSSNGNLYHRNNNGSWWSSWSQILEYVEGASTDINNLYDTGIYPLRPGSNCPDGVNYGVVLVMSYRKASGNSSPDFAVQIYISNGDAGSNAGMYWRMGMSTSWASWHRVS